MGFYERRILPRFIELSCGTPRLDKVRARALEGLRGEVLEIGFGTGANVPLYPDAVTRVLAVEPSELARELAARRVGAGRVPVEYVGLDGQALALPDASVDCVLSTWSLCTIPDAGAALAEARRVLRPGGELFVLEHGLSPDPAVARWQHRLTPVQRRVAGGCHLDRPIDELVRAAGFEFTRLFRFVIAGPKTFGSMYAGVAVPTSGGGADRPAAAGGT